MAFSVRPTTIGDLAAVEEVLQSSYPSGLRSAYPPALLDRALPYVTRAQPDLLRSGRYYLALEDKTGAPLGVGGWSVDAVQVNCGYMRHVATHSRALRSGVGRAIVAQSLHAARAMGVTEMICHATVNAMPFYRSLGFDAVGQVDLSFAPDLVFSAMKMRLQLD